MCDKECKKLDERKYFRAQFAGMALQGLLASPDVLPANTDGTVYLAELAVIYADELIKALNKE
jgi:hypothetical protein